MSIWGAAFSLFIVCNVVGNLPFYLALLKHFPKKRQIEILMREMVIALGILLLFGFFGDQVLRLLGLSQRIIEIGGGLLLLLLSLNMLFPKPGAALATENYEPMIVPIATPGTAGPGGIATVMLLGSQLGSIWAVTSMILIAWIPSIIILFFACHLQSKLRPKVLVAVERFGGLLMSLIAVQMITYGTIQLIKENFFS